MKYSSFSLTMKLHGFLGLPAMTLREVEIIKSVLLSFNKKESLNIFEYGSGYSTCYFGKFLKEKNVKFRIHSIDNNIQWHDKVKNLVNKAGIEEKVILDLYDFPPFWEKEGWSWDCPQRCGEFSPCSDSEHAYINALSKTKEKYDFILIDARFRRRCLELAHQCLNENGIVCLHDAQKAHYHDSLSQYTHSVFINSGKYYPFDKGVWKIWLGSNDNTSIYSIHNII